MHHRIVIGMTLISLAFGGETAAQAAHQAGSAATAQAPARERAPAIYMIRYRPGHAYRSDTPLMRQDLRAHGRYMQDLARRGIILAAGPTFTEAGGLVLVQAADLPAARSLMMADPAVQNGVFAGEISDWRPLIDPGGLFRRPGEPRR